MTPPEAGEVGRARFRKKPVEVVAHQLTEDADWDAIAVWCNGRLVNRERADSGDYDTWLLIDTLGGTIEAQEGDWIICGVACEFYPCTPDIFEATYDPA